MNHYLVNLIHFEAYQSSVTEGFDGGKGWRVYLIGRWDYYFIGTVWKVSRRWYAEAGGYQPQQNGPYPTRWEAAERLYIFDVLSN